MRHKLPAVAVGLACLCLFGGLLTGAPKEPPDPRLTGIGDLYVLPIVDARAGNRAKIDLSKMQDQLVRLLDRKHYPAKSTDTSLKIDEEDLQAADPAFVRKLGPADSRWIIVVCLEDVASKIGFGSSGNAAVSGYLFDKEAATSMIWQNKGVGQAGQGGLAGMAFKGMMNGAAIDAAFLQMFRTLPTHPKPGK